MIRRTLSAAALALTLAACATAPGPVEVTRFIAPAASTQLAQGSIFVQSADGQDNLELAPYNSAVAAELGRQGYRESARAGARQIAEVRVERYQLGSNGGRSPVSVGVGGSTGSYGSGVGLGVGINLGGGSGNQVGTEMRVVIRDAASSQVLWEGRADFAVAENSPLADRVANAQTVAAALFSEFPGKNGETVEVRVPE